MNNLWNSFHEEFGPPAAQQPVSLLMASRYRDKLPGAWLRHWVRFGFAAWGNGLFWTVEPGDYAVVLEAWLEGTPFEDGDDYQVVARSAFGKLFVWSNRNGHFLTINAPMDFLAASHVDLRNFIETGEPDAAVDLFFGAKSRGTLDVMDDAGCGLFTRAAKVLGSLESDEMYGFEPALVLGGLCDLRNLRRVKAVPHLLLLAALSERKVLGSNPYLRYYESGFTDASRPNDRRR